MEVVFELSGGGAKPSPETPEIELVAYDGSGQELARQKSRREFNEPPLPLDFSGQTPLIEIKTRRTGKPIQLYVVEREGERCRVRVSPGGTGSGCGGRAVKRTEVAVHPNQIGRPARDAPPLG